MGALRQVRVKNWILMGMGLLTLGGTVGNYFAQRSASASFLHKQREEEVIALETRFLTEKRRLDEKAQGLRENSAQTSGAEEMRKELERLSGLERNLSISNERNANSREGSSPTFGRLKRFLIEDSGKVLAHSDRNEIGTEAKALVRRLKENEKKGRFSTKSWEGYPATVLFGRVPGWNVFYGVEQVHAPAKAGLGMGPLQAIVLLIGLVLGVAFIAAGFRGRSEEPEEESLNLIEKTLRAEKEAAKAEKVAKKPQPIVRAPAKGLVPPEDPSTELDRFVSARIKRSEGYEKNLKKQARALLESFDREARREKGDVDALEAKLVESVSRAAKSPVLFFRYEPQQGIARLSTELGSPVARSFIDSGAAGISFALGSTLVSEIYEAEARGQKKNLWDQSSVRRLIVSRFGVANFEAWPMIRARNLDGTQGRLLGVLVIVQAGVESLVHRDFLATLLDRASRHYDA